MGAAEQITAREQELLNVIEDLQSKVEDLKSDLESKGYRIEELEDEIEDAKGDKRGAAGAVAASVHNFLRDSKIITDPDRDVPFRITPHPYCADLLRAVTEGLE